MSEEELGKIIESIAEDYGSKDLAREAFMLSQIKYFLGLDKPAARIILCAAREVKGLRGDRRPDWALLMTRH